MPTVGSFVLLNTGGKDGDALPLLVTHDHGNDVVSGVAFSGRPFHAGWLKPYDAMTSVQRGTEKGQWQPRPGAGGRPPKNGGKNGSDAK